MTVESFAETVYFDSREGEERLDKSEPLTTSATTTTTKTITTATTTGPIDISLPSSGFANPFQEDVVEDSPPPSITLTSTGDEQKTMPGEYSWESDVATGRLYEEAANGKEGTKVHLHPNGSEGWLPTEDGVVPDQTGHGGHDDGVGAIQRDYVAITNGNGHPSPRLIPISAPPSVLPPSQSQKKDRHGEMMNYAPRSFAQAHEEEESQAPSPTRYNPGQQQRLAASDSQGTGGLAPMDSLSRRASVRSAFTSRTDRTAGGGVGGFVPSLFESRKAAGGGAFADGAATTAPTTLSPPPDSTSLVHDASLPERKAKAEGALTERQKSRVWKKEVGQGRRLSKVIREEAKTQSASLDIALKELEHTQRVQKKAVKEEGKQVEVHNRLVEEYKRSEKAFLEAQERFERMKGEVIAQERRLEMVRDGARDATLSLAMKAEEVERLRRTFAVDERERALRLKELKGVN